MSYESFDLIVIGSGPAGYVGAIRAAQLGLNTACVEKDGTLGGTCLNVGCIPSKALLDSSEHFHFALAQMKSHGIEATGIELNLTQMLKRKDQIVRQLTNGIKGLFRKNKIASYQGWGNLAGQKDGMHLVQVHGAEETKTIAAKNILLATGSVPVELPFMPFDGKKVVSSTEALSFDQVPRHLVVVGGGVIGLELGSVWQRLGAKVTVIEFQNRLIPTMDHQLGKEIQKVLTKQGFEFLLSHKCLGAEISGEWALVGVEDLNTGEQSKLECDRVLVATGRRPFSDNLGLDQAGVQLDDRGTVVIDDHFKTNVPGIYAVGDLVRGPMLAHKGEEEGIAAVEIIAGQSGHVNYNAIPGVIYTWPEVAAVGKTEEELKEAKIEYRSGTFPFLANGRAKAMGESDGFVKILADARTDRVLGVHIIGPRAGDLISEAVTAMEYGGSAEDIARTCHAHPTLCEVVKEAALAVDKRQIHI